jgi:two-component system, OmpR family, sensor kinase
VSRLPIRLRLTLAFALGMALVLGATGLFLHLRLRDSLDEQIELSLRARADDVAALVRRGGALGEGRERLSETDESFAQVLGFRDGAVRDSAPELTVPLLTPEQLDRARGGITFVDREEVPGGDDDRVRLLATPINSPQGVVIVVTGTSLEDRDEALGALRTQLLIGGPLALLLASLAGYGVAGAALRPVEAMRRRAEEVSSTARGQRLPVPAAEDELARLARTLNEMLDRLEAGLERERRFAADASHELRTPLSLLKTELELALRRPRSPDELRAALSSAADETERLVLLADDLLVLARSDEGELRITAERVPVRELLETVERRFAARAGRAGRVLEVDSPEALEIAGDRLRLEQALGNLVDNALRHGEGAITISAATRDSTAELHVLDEGPGFPNGFGDKAFEPFSRAAPSGDGSGLGLAIVETIVRAHDGEVAATARPSGGADVSIRLPL